MKLSVNLVHQGCYVKAGDSLPPDFVLPPHLDRFVIYDEPPPQISRVDHRFSSGVEGHQEKREAGTRLAKPAMNYTESEEEFAPQWGKAKKHAPKERKGKGL
jgi:hypothetical protein